MTVQGKAKGNSYERKVAKELSLWIFDDPHMLKREPSSGAQKHSYTGDLMPYKQIPWKRWPIHIETKSGYSQFTPTFFNYSKIEEWFTKAYFESKTHNQNLIFLICQFLNKYSLLITDTCIPCILFKVAIPICINGSVIYTYVYKYKDVLQKKFEDCFKLENI
jgi:hypothetical protein